MKTSLCPHCTAAVLAVIMALPIGGFTQTTGTGGTSGSGGGTSTSGGAGGSRSSSSSSGGAQRSTTGGANGQRTTGATNAQNQNNANARQPQAGAQNQNQNQNPAAQNQTQNQNPNARQQNTIANPSVNQQQPGNQNQNPAVRGTNTIPNPSVTPSGAPQNATGQPQGTTPNRTMQPGTNNNTIPNPAVRQGTGTVQNGQPQNPNSSAQNNNGNNTNSTTANGSVQSNASTNAGTTTNAQGAISDTGGVPMMSGTMANFGEMGFALQGSGEGDATTFRTNEQTVFTDMEGRQITSEGFNRKGPATVYYTRVGDDLIATRVVAQTDARPYTAGKVTEVTPGVLVVELPGASDTPVKYVNDKTTNYVDENGEPVPPETLTAGTPVRVFYTKVGDTLVASKVEVVGHGSSGLPKPPIEEESSQRLQKKE